MISVEPARNHGCRRHDDGYRRRRPRPPHPVRHANFRRPLLEVLWQDVRRGRLVDREAVGRRLAQRRSRSHVDGRWYLRIRFYGGRGVVSVGSVFWGRPLWRGGKWRGGHSAKYVEDCERVLDMVMMAGNMVREGRRGVACTYASQKRTFDRYLDCWVRVQTP